mgnify:CR=1 FL=1
MGLPTRIGRKSTKCHTPRRTQFADTASLGRRGPQLPARCGTIPASMVTCFGMVSVVSESIKFGYSRSCQALQLSASWLSRLSVCTCTDVKRREPSWFSTLKNKKTTVSDGDFCHFLTEFYFIQIWKVYLRWAWE